MKRQLAFVLGGGGARGALQVGALRAVLEREIIPDLLVGTSIGAVNGAFLALRGLHLGSLDALAEAWLDASRLDLLPSNYLWLTVRSLFNRPSVDIRHRMLHFFRDHGLNPDLCFGDIQKVRLLTVAADLNNGRTVLFGLDPKESVLEGVLASSALPPWIRPMVKDGQYLMDGGAVSTLPVEPALSTGATEIIAFDLFDPRDGVGDMAGFGPFLRKLLATVEQRQIELELALAAAVEVPVKHIRLSANLPTPLWDFRSTQDLIRCGYEQARAQIDGWQLKRKPRWFSLMDGRGKKPANRVERV